MERIPALTVWQPWAGSIIFAAKSPENRPKPVSYRGPLRIHAGLKVDWDAPDMAWAGAGLCPPPRSGRFDRKNWTHSLALGAIIGTVTVTGCHHWSECDPPCTQWAALGQWHIELSGPVPLLRPVPCKGALGLWTIPEDVEAAVRAQFARNPGPDGFDAG